MKTQFPDRYFGVNENADIPSAKEVYKNTRSYRHDFIKFVEKLPKNAKVLDVGCGSGKAIKMMIAIRPDLEITGIDISDTSGYLPESVKFYVAGVDDMNNLFDENQFDAIVSHHVVEHLDTPISMMESSRIILKPGGQIFIETPNWIRMIVPFSKLYFWNDYTHKRIFSKQTMRRLMRDFGFRITKLKTTNSIRISDVFKHKIIRERGKKTDEVQENKNNNQKIKINILIKIFKAVKYLLSILIHMFVYDILIVIAKNEK
jgi:2-polyprenyl-3-methyl-5-hydroxy-6-metoxy-1,4-benzoquinol methylase